VVPRVDTVGLGAEALEDHKAGPTWGAAAEVPCAYSSSPLDGDRETYHQHLGSTPIQT